MLNEWALVLRFAPDVVVNNTEDDDDPCDQHAVIHVLGGGGRFRRPEAPEQDEQYVNACKRVVDYAE